MRRDWVRGTITAPPGTPHATTAPPLNPDQMFMRFTGGGGALDEIKAEVDTFVRCRRRSRAALRLQRLSGPDAARRGGPAGAGELDHLVTTHAADRDAVDSRGRTALDHAARGNKPNNITALDALGVDVDAADAAGWTAYDVAVAGGFKAASVQLAGLMRTANPIGPDPEALPPIVGPRTTPAILAAATKSMDPSMGPAQLRAMYDALYAYEDLRPILDIAAVEAIQSRATDPNALRIFLSDNDSTMLLRNAYPYGSYNDLDQRTSGAITQKLEGTVTVGGSREKTESGGQEVASKARTMLGTLIDELTDHAARKIFDNNAVPVDKNDHVGLQLYLAAYREDSVRWIDEALAPGTSAARKVGFEDIEGGYGKLHLQLQEIIVRAPQSLVQFGEVAEKALPSQIQYFRTQFLPRATQFVNTHAQTGQLQNPNAPGKTDFSDVPGVGPETISLAGLDAAWLAKKVVARITNGRHTEVGDHATKLDSQLDTGVDTELGGFTDTNRVIGQRQGRGKLHKKADEAAITKALTKAIPKAKPKTFTDKQLEVDRVDDLVAQLATAARANKLSGFEKILKPFYA